MSQPFLHLINVLLRIRLHGFDFLHWDKSQHLHAFHHVGIVHIAPVLEEIIRRGLLGIQPDSVAGRLAHLVPLRIG